jgi:hypothetical protein
MVTWRGAARYQHPRTLADWLNPRVIAAVMSRDLLTEYSEARQQD